MSIQTELTRLTNAKAAIQTAIEGKGVTVPSGTLLDGMAALIDGIKAGEDAFPPYKSIYAGTITPSNNMTYSDFAHTITESNITVEFNTYCVTCQDREQVTDKYSIYSVCKGGDVSHVGRAIAYNGTKNTFASTAPYAWKVGSTTYVLQAGVTYYYVCGVI